MNKKYDANFKELEQGTDLYDSYYPLMLGLITILRDSDNAFLADMVEQHSSCWYLDNSDKNLICLSWQGIVFRFDLFITPTEIEDISSEVSRYLFFKAYRGYKEDFQLIDEGDYFFNFKIDLDKEGISFEYDYMDSYKPDSYEDIQNYFDSLMNVVLHPDVFSKLWRYLCTEDSSLSELIFEKSELQFCECGFWGISIFFTKSQKSELEALWDLLLEFDFNLKISHENYEYWSI